MLTARTGNVDKDEKPEGSNGWRVCDHQTLRVSRLEPATGRLMLAVRTGNVVKDEKPEGSDGWRACDHQTLRVSRLELTTQ